MTDWYSDPQYKATVVTPLTENQAAVYLKEAFEKLLGYTPKVATLSIFWAQCALEGARFTKQMCNNWGNLKKVHAPKDDGFNFCTFKTGENLYNPVTKKVEWKVYLPPDPITHFRAYDTPLDGALDYLTLLSKRTRYANAWQAALNGDVVAYNHALKIGSYYTAPENLYLKGLQNLTSYFIKNATNLLKDLPENIQTPPENTKLFTPEEESNIMSLVSLTNNMSIDEYFQCSLNDNTGDCDKDQNEQA